MEKEIKLDIPPTFTVLIADDDHEARKTVQEYLAALGFNTVLVATNGYEAYNLVQREPVDLIISDWEMPIVSGIELLKTLKKEEAFKNIPFIMATSPASQEQIKVEEAAALQVDAYLTKPFRLQTLKQKLGEILEEHKADLVRGVLVVDDDPVVRGTIVEILESMTYKPIFTASDGEEGFSVLKKNAETIALVISDWEMPKLKGIDFLRRVRADVKLQNIAFLMCTSQSSIEHIKVDMAIQAEVDHYVIKPFNVETLLTKVDAVMKNVRIHRKISSRLEDAKKLIKDGDYFNAKRLYKHVQRLDPKNVDAYLGLAHVKILERPDRGFDEAIYLVREAINMNPALDYPYIELASVYERAASLDKAAAALTEGVAACPMSPKLNYHLGRLLLKLGRQQQAIAALEKTVQLQPDHQEAGQLLRGSSKPAQETKKKPAK